ncbi:succinyl-diaminopimelate desuccinylase [bacterium]|nr:succinyl-diaminopimelate desuccinylase [bacterium]
MVDTGERLARDLLELCSIRSEYGNERAIADHVQARLSRTPLRASVRRVGDSVIAGAPSGARATIALLGHLDTVPDAGNAWPPRREGDTIFGLGASDMKAGLAVMLALAEDRDEKASSHDLVLVFYDKEEGPDAANGLEPVLEACPFLKESALAFCLEPTDGDLHLGCLGGLHAKVTFRGRSAHSARPWQGENAITKAGAFLAELHAVSPRDVTVGPGLVYREVTTVTLAKGGTGRNVVPRDLELNVNVRFAPGKTLEDAERELRSRVAGRADVEIVDRSLPGKVPERNSHLERFERLSGARVAPKQAWTDVARLSARGIDAVNYGPGFTAQAHQKDERASVALTVQAYEVFSRFLAPGKSSP